MFDNYYFVTTHFYYSPYIDLGVARKLVHTYEVYGKKICHIFPLFLESSVVLNITFDFVFTMEANFEVVRIPGIGILLTFQIR